MSKITKLLTTLSLCAALAGCYHPDIQQGNNLRSTQVQHLKVGMTRSQVIDLLGDPVLQNVFDPNTLVYIYTNLPNDNDYTQHKMILTFHHDRLVKIMGGYSN